MFVKLDWGSSVNLEFSINNRVMFVPYTILESIAETSLKPDVWFFSSFPLYSLK